MIRGNCKMFTEMHDQSRVKPLRKTDIQNDAMVEKLIWPIQTLLKVLLFEIETSPQWWKCSKWMFFHVPLLAYQLLLIGLTCYIISRQYQHFSGNCLSWGIALVIMQIENVFGQLWLLRYGIQSDRILQEISTHITLRAATSEKRKRLLKLLRKLRFIVPVSIITWLIPTAITIGIAIYSMIVTNIFSREMFTLLVLKGEQPYIYITIVNGIGMSITSCFKMATTALISYTCSMVQHKLDETETIALKYKTETFNLPEDFRNRRIVMDAILKKTHECHMEGCRFVSTYDDLISFYLLFSFACDVVSFILAFRMLQDSSFSTLSVCRYCTCMLIIAAFLAKYWFTSAVNTKVSEVLKNIPGADIAVKHNPDNNHSTETQANLQIYCALMAMKPPSLTAWKLFSITRGFLLDIVGTAVTYTIFLYQSLRMHAPPD